MSIKQTLKRILPDFILKPLQKIHYVAVNRERLIEEGKLIAQTKTLQEQALEKVRKKKGPLNVVFFALMDSVWKYDELYQLMEKDTRFNSTILVCPVVTYGRDNMLMNMDKCYNLFKSRGYNVIRSYNSQTDKYIDVREELKPDIIFYTNPYEGLIDDRYYITQFPEVLSCYVPYYMSEANHPQISYNTLFQNLLWRFYLETEYAHNVACINSRIKGRNVVVSGYPGIDKFIYKKYLPKDNWKIKDNKVKRIIWAPHHTITDYTFVSYSTFLYYYDFMFELANKYKNKIQITFKPHPLLKNRLDLMWGKEKTLEYYEEWKNLENGMLNDGAYEDLFLTSDVIIHDSGSFIGEYLYTGKPAMFLSNGRDFKVQYNAFAQECLKHYYIGKNKEDIEIFIVNLINGKDMLKEKRNLYLKNKLMPPNGKLASENIIDNLVKELIPE